MSDWSVLRVLETKCQGLRSQLSTDNFPLRERNRVQADLAVLEQKIRRQELCRSVYQQLVPSIRAAPSRRQQQQQQRSVRRADEKVSHPQAEAFIKDLTLPCPPPADKTHVFIDYCKCGELMQRHPTMSFTICPACFCKRVEIDMCARDLSAFIDSRSDSQRARVSATGQKSSFKNASHYGTFLNSNRARKTKTVNMDRLLQLCMYCYVEGARSPNDISPKIVNRAQKHLQKHSNVPIEYPLTRTYVSLLRDDNISIPDTVKTLLMRLYSYVQPVYSRYRATTADDPSDNRTNMPKFTFVTRILCRLIGMDVLVPLFDNFSMSDIVVRRTAVMRRVFTELGWVWSDSLADDITSKMLDAYDAVVDAEAAAAEAAAAQ
jgi:hypothetical protein